MREYLITEKRMCSVRTDYVIKSDSKEEALKQHKLGNSNKTGYQVILSSKKPWDYQVEEND